MSPAPGALLPPPTGRFGVLYFASSLAGCFGETLNRYRADPALAFLSRELSGALAVLGYDQLDVALVRGRDRRVTRLISEWAWRQADDDSLSVAFGGIRYLSRTNSDWECWAVFDDMALAEVERQPILLTTPGLREVAELYDLKVF